MTIKRYENATAKALNKVLEGYRMVHEEFGDMGTGKTTRANDLADRLAKQGKLVIVVDGLERGAQGGVRVFVRG